MDQEQTVNTEQPQEVEKTKPIVEFKELEEYNSNLLCNTVVL